MVRHQHRDTGDTKKQGSLMLPGEHNFSPELAPELKKLYEMTASEFRIIIVWKVTEIQESMDRLKK